MTYSIRKLALIPALALAAACGKDQAKQDVDPALANDLSLAGQAQPQQQFVSPTELGVDSASLAPAPQAAPAPAPTRVSSGTRASSSTRRTASASSTTRRRTTPRHTETASASSDEGSYSGGSSAGTYTPAPAPAPVEVKHTKRDAVIGAAAGAVLGGATSRDRVKGAVIGAAAGGVLGAIIGNNVDKSKKPAPQF